MTDATDADAVPGDEPAAPPPRWGLGDAAFAFVAGLVGTIVTTSLYVLVRGDSGRTGTGIIVASLVGLWAGFGGVAISASRRKGTGSLAEDYGLRIERRDVGIGILAGVLSQYVLVTVIVSLFNVIDSSVDVGDQAQQVTGEAGGIRLLALAPFLLLGAPFFEELYFRGLLQRAAVRRLGAGAGICLSALAFGLVHGTADLGGWSMLALITALAAFGAVLSWLAHRSGRLGPNIVAHATFNSLTLLSLAIAQ